MATNDEIPGSKDTRVETADYLANLPFRAQPSYDEKPEEKQKSDIVITIIAILIIINLVLLILDYFSIVNFAAIAKSMGLPYR